MTILVTGGAGFFGSSFALGWLVQPDEPVINVDALSCAGNLVNLAAVDGDFRHIFVKGSICEFDLVADSMPTLSAKDAAGQRSRRASVE